MALSSFYVGATITFTATFTKADGTPFLPPSASLSLQYILNGTTYETTVAMDDEGEGVFTYAWDTHWMEPTVIRWDIRNDHEPVAVTVGRFFLKASAAAPAVAS